MRRRLAILLFLTAAIARPPAAAGDGEAPRLERFLQRSGPLCAREPAAGCLSRLFAYLDADRDRRLRPGELRRARAEAGAWLARHRDRLPPLERNLSDGLLWTVDLVGIDSLFAAYDTNRDGRLTAGELFADIRTDDRPLGELLRDPEGLDWPRMRRRFGRAAMLLEMILAGLRRARLDGVPGRAYMQEDAVGPRSGEEPWTTSRPSSTCGTSSPPSSCSS